MEQTENNRFNRGSSRLKNTLWLLLLMILFATGLSAGHSGIPQGDSIICRDNKTLYLDLDTENIPELMVLVVCPEGRSVFLENIRQAGPRYTRKIHLGTEKSGVYTVQLVRNGKRTSYQITIRE
jgi:hypothetical protein